MQPDPDELDTQIGMAATLIWRLREVYEARVREQATVCIKLASKWNVEVYPRNQFHSEWREFGAADKLADAISICILRVNKLATKED